MTGQPSPRRGVRAAQIVVLVLALLAGAGFAWRAWATHPQGEPQAAEFTDAVIGPALAGATVLALGEATHGNAEFQDLRTGLARALPTFRTIVFEEDAGAVALVDEYVRGGQGTAEQAASRFGFALNQTEQMARFLQFVRDRNASLPAPEQTRLAGIDVQRVDANKQRALGWLAGADAAGADALATALAGLTDDRRTAADYRDASEAIDRLVAALEAAGAASSPEGRAALASAWALRQGRDLQQETGRYAAVRAEIMAANLARIAEERAADGHPQLLLFAHAGHVEKTGAAFPEPDLGELAAQRWGQGYRVIGTDVVASRFRAGDAEGQRRDFTLRHPTPLRGIFAGTRVGYLEMASATGANADLLRRPVPMASAGDQFADWMAWVPPLHTVTMVPADAYDALILVADATPTIPLAS
ncbi:MAG: erythromycin esterase family protein [Propioniciclava sp.]|uniref:erythromycin esterase family protein n=1 Tax=Propioniciclava sp. TaxID=2038686 RepID=UPI0039E5D6E7